MSHTVCPYCGSFSIEKICGAREPTNHYGRLVCNDCGRWIAWIPKPEKITAQLARNDFIQGLLLSSRLNSWEREFLRDIKSKSWLTLRQKQKFDQIALKINGAVYSHENTPSRGSGRGERAIFDSG